MNYKLILIPTNEKSSIVKCIKDMSDIKIGKLFIQHPLFTSLDYWQYQHLVLLSDEKIKKEEDYIAWETNYATEPSERWVIYNRISELNGVNQQKIIATSSKELTPNSTISLDKQKEIIEYYNENGLLPKILIIPNGDCNYESDGTDECLCGSKSFKDCNSYCNAPSYINSEIQFDIVKQTNNDFIEQEKIKFAIEQLNDLDKKIFGESNTVKSKIKEIRTKNIKFMIQLIKLPQGNILISDETIKAGDIPYDTYAHRNTVWSREVTESDLQNNNLKSCYKIIAGLPTLPAIDYSKEVCKEIGFEDVEKIAEVYLNKQYSRNQNDYYTERKKIGNLELELKRREFDFIEGFKAAQSLNDKKYSELDVWKILTLYELKQAEYLNRGVTDFDHKQIVTDVIQSLSQPKVWDVEATLEGNTYIVTKIIK